MTKFRKNLSNTCTKKTREVIYDSNKMSCILSNVYYIDYNIEYIYADRLWLVENKANRFKAYFENKFEVVVFMTKLHAYLYDFPLKLDVHHD